MVREAADAWHCVAQPMSDPDHFVAILRLPSPCQLRNEDFFRIVEQIPDVIARFDRSMRYLYVNPAVEQADPERPVHLRIGRSQVEIDEPSALADLWRSAYRTIFETGERIEREFEFPAPDGPRHFVLRLVPEFGAAVTKLEKGAITQEPVKTQFGYHVIQLDAVRGGDKKPFAEVRPLIEDEVRKQLATKRWAEAAAALLQLEQSARSGEQAASRLRKLARGLLGLLEESPGRRGKRSPASGPLDGSDFEIAPLRT